jgi:hypothetical protein
MKKRSFAKDTSGQVLIVTALLVALLLLSTAVYVMETTKQIPKVNADVTSSFCDYKQAARSTLVSALSNITGGGNPNILAEDISQLKAVLQSNSFQSILTIDYNLPTRDSYQNGMRISWGTNGGGVSSAYASFTFNSVGPSTTSSIDCTVNVTSQISASGTYIQEANQKMVHLTLHLLNEGEPALAQNFAFSYQNDTDWVTVDSPVVVNLGDGSYSAAFSVESPQEIQPLDISVLCIDHRGISVGANLTCIN